jgi:hypothetical protein
LELMGNSFSVRKELILKREEDEEEEEDDER